MNQTARRAHIKDLSNKAEGIFQYVGNYNVLFRLISTGNELTSDVNFAVALFTDFARAECPEVLMGANIDYEAGVGDSAEDGEMAHA